MANKLTFEFVRYHQDREIHIPGYILVTLGMMIIGLLIYLGFAQNQSTIQDVEKRKQITSVLLALDQYYSDSSPFLESRQYPIAQCSNELNSFDYEYSLRTELVGNQFPTPGHSYILAKDFPYDPMGTYTKTLPKDSACRDIQPAAIADRDSYFDNSNVCQFNISRQPNCYLYTSSLSGDSFKLAYYSPQYKKYVVYSKYRTKDLEAKLF